MSLISVVIPVYNAEDTLDRCIQSLLAQTFTEIDIILINDGSTDCSAKICDDYQSKDTRITVLHKNNEGVSSARNIGLKYVNSEYIMFVDSDDYVERDICEKLYEKVIETDSELVLCGYSRIFYAKNIFNHIVKIIPNCYDVSSVVDLRRAYGKLYTKALFNMVWGKLYKLSILKNREIFFDETLSLGEDLLFNHKYMKYICKIGIVNESLYNYLCTNEDSLTKRFDYKHFSLIKLLYYESISFCNSKNIISKNIASVNKMFIRSCFIHIEQVFFGNTDISKKEKISLIKNIINDPIVMSALKINKKVDLEFFVYELACISKSVILVYLTSLLRRFIKKMIRGLEW